MLLLILLCTQILLMCWAQNPEYSHQERMKRYYSEHSKSFIELAKEYKRRSSSGGVLQHKRRRKNRNRSGSASFDHFQTDADADMVQSKRDDRAVVIASIKKSYSCAYMPSELPCYNVYKPEVTKSQGEMFMWLTWIIEHYDNLPNYVALLHDGVKQWHHTSRYNEFIKYAKPQNRLALGLTQIDGNHVAADEEQCVYRILHVVNKKYSKHRNDGYCCTESILSRQTIEQYPKEAYQEWLDMLKDIGNQQMRGKCIKYGYAWERAMSNVFGVNEYLTSVQAGLAYVTK